MLQHANFINLNVIIVNLMINIMKNTMNDEEDIVDDGVI
jgi:hypothetical protein